ncbi:MAG: HigA family addiction module antidote protein [Gammaproteobacteria bacterium]|nr:HigA family addiction module antidote protein [Gammaproteobacteria bacterium]MCH1550636.1 HigA family addiction module antitoxin [Pseudomonadales bacterium]
MSAPHPGELVDRLILQPAAISQSELARRLGFNQPQPVNELVKGKRGFTPKMALLFEQVTNGQYPAEFWLAAQVAFDVQRAKKELLSTRRAPVAPLDTSLDVEAHSEVAGCHGLVTIGAGLAALTA